MGSAQSLQEMSRFEMTNKIFFSDKNIFEFICQCADDNLVCPHYKFEVCLLFFSKKYINRKKIIVPFTIYYILQNPYSIPRESVSSPTKITTGWWNIVHSLAQRDDATSLYQEMTSAKTPGKNTISLICPSVP